MALRRLIEVIVLALFAAGAAGGAALAATGPWLENEQGRVRLVSAGDSTGDGALRLGLQFELEPGWKIYWRSPGDAGYPPALDWSASRNLEQAELRWPVPHRFSLFGLETFGYGGDVVLPIAAQAARPDEGVELRADINYLTCSEICVPLDGRLSLDLPAGPASSARDALLIDQADSLVPGDGSRVGLSLESVRLVEGGEHPVLEVAARSNLAFDAPDLLVEAPPGFVFDVPEVQLSDDGKSALLRLASARGPQAEGVLEGKRLTLTLFDGKRALEAEVIGRYAEPPAGFDLGGAVTGGAGAGAAGFSLIAVLGFALLGGLILNLMPCVLPVLSIKLLSAVSHGGRDQGQVRAGFLASAAGILASFLLLAAAAVAIKAAGLAAGWGLQFQQPLFLSAMAVIVTLFAGNLFGLFELHLPGRLADAAAQAGGHGHASLTGHFLTGAFATLLATPCSAPFVGTAIGFALARGAGEIFLVFAFLGLGLALPYLAVAAWPGLATRLPRPGPWMLVLRRILGLALIATAVWLLWVLAGQVGSAAAIVVGGLLAAIVLLLALRHLRPLPAVTALIAIAALAAIAAPAGFETQSRPAGSAVAQAWEPFDRARIGEQVAEGKIVFVDVTADWCLTCQVNKRLVIDQEPVAGLLARPDVVAMRADWTLPSDEISDYLASFGRYGIPFDAVYGPELPQGQALPELLSSGGVVEALQRAAGDGRALAAQ